MIKLNTIHVEEFRGIRNLKLDLSAKNFGICGPNGTGKSGVVDAIEFCLTGDVTRLSGRGTTGISVKTHAPHVDHQKNPERSKVTITAVIPALRKTVKLHRSVKTPKKLLITPDDEDVKVVIEELEQHPEFALSRREIVKYIITPPGNRSEDVQNLLRLGSLEKLRKSVRTFANNCEQAATAKKQLCASAESDLTTILNLKKLDSVAILEKVNEKRQVLGLPVITELTKGISFTAEEEAPKGNNPNNSTLHKSTALKDIEALQTVVSGNEHKDLIVAIGLAKRNLEKLRDDDLAVILARRHGLIQTGLDLVTDDACPLCDKPWDANELREHLRKKLLDAEEIQKPLEGLRDNFRTILGFLSDRTHAMERAIDYCKKLDLPENHITLSGYIQSLKKIETVLNGFLEDHSQVVATLDAVSTSWWTPDDDIKRSIEGCRKAVLALPNVSVEVQDRDFLVVAQERYQKFLQATKSSKQYHYENEIAQCVLKHYNDACTVVLDKIYDDVAKDFSNYYRVINGEDEATFTSKLSPGPAKLNFDVDFYGRGRFPPGAYHSEGHQDGMGLCLYLALMNQTLGDKFTFAVLDDVLMSVDTGHRREVCRLLKSEFPYTQFVLTTHDRVWLQYMKTEGIIENSQLFGGWTVDTGPRVWDDNDIWTEIQSELNKNDVAKAAALLRRYLEFTATCLANNLRARVEFKGDGHYDLGDLMPHAMKKWRENLELGEKSAIYWHRDEEKTDLAQKRANTKNLIAKTKVEEWAINPSLHFNEWANLQGHEFQDVVNAFKACLEDIRCANCMSYYYVLPSKGPAEELRCDCGTTTINLKVN